MNTFKIQLDKYAFDQAEYVRLRNALTNVLNPLSIHESVAKIQKQVSLIDSLPTSNSWSDIKIRNLEGCVDKLFEINTFVLRLSNDEIQSLQRCHR